MTIKVWGILEGPVSLDEDDEDIDDTIYIVAGDLA